MRGLWKYFSPSISHLIFVVVLLQLTFNIGNRLLEDADTGYHIRAGEIILETVTVPTHDDFSFRSPKLEWTAHEWLSEVAMALIHRFSGLTGIVLFFIFLISLTYAWFFRIVRSYGRIFLADLAIVLLVIACSQIHWLARPHIFSLPLMILWYSILDRFEYGEKNLLYLLPPLMLLWVNLHGGFIIGIVLIGIYLFGNLCRFLTSNEGAGQAPRRRIAYLGITLCACVLVSLANPQGYRILLFPFKLATNSFLMDHVDEFQSPNFHENFFFLVFLVFTFGILILSRTGMNLIEWMLVLLFFAMSLSSERYIPLFGIIVAPVLAKHAGGLVENRRDSRFAGAIGRSSGRIAAIDENSRGYLWPVGAVLLALLFAGSGKIHFQFDPKKKPVSAVEFLEKENLKGNMFNNDEFGDYVIYKAYPRYKVFVDGRSDMYGSDNFKEYSEIASFGPSMESLVRKYDINWIFFDSDSFLSRYLVQNRDWHLIYSDPVASIFIRNTPENRDVIERYGNVTLYSPGSMKERRQTRDRETGHPEEKEAGS